MIAVISVNNMEIRNGFSLLCDNRDEAASRQCNDAVKGIASLFAQTFAEL